MKIFMVVILLFSSINSSGNFYAKEQLALSASTLISDTTMANGYFKKAMQFDEQALFDSSLYYLKIAKEIYEQVAEQTNDPGLWEKHIKCLNEMGYAFSMNHEGEKALDCFQKALDIGTKNFVEYHPEVATSCIGIGEILGKDKAIEYYNRALKIRSKLYGEYHPHTAECYQRIGISYYQKDDYDGALKLFEKSIAVLKESSEKGDRELAYAYRMIGNINSRKGDYEKAILNFKKEIELVLQFVEANHLKVAETYTNTGLTYLNKGDYHTALEFFNKASSIVINKYGENHPNVSYLFVGNAYYRKGEFEQAIKYYLKTVEIKLSAPGDYRGELAQLYNNIGISYLEIDSLRKSLEYINKSLKIKIELVGDNTRYVTSNYNNLGLLYSKQKNYDKSLDYYQKSLTIRRNLYGEKHPDVADSYQLIGEVYLKQNRFEDALNYFQRAIIASVADFNDLNVYHNPGLQNAYAKTQLLAALASKAEILEKRCPNKSKDLKDLQMSLATSKLASDLIDKLRGEYEAEGSKLMLGATAHQLYDNSIRTALKIHNITSDPEIMKLAFLFSEKSKINVLLDGIRESRAVKLGGIPDSLRQREKDLKIDLAFYETEIQKEKLKQSKQDSTKIREYEDHYFAIRRDYKKLVDRFENAYPKYYELKYKTETAAISDVQASLDNETAMLEYYLVDNSISVFVITNDDLRVATTSIDLTFLNKIDSLRFFIIRNDQNGFIRIAQQFYKQLIAPIISKLENKANLIIIPHGSLCIIPFEALLTGGPVAALGRTTKQLDKNYSDLKYLVKKFNISYHYSATLYLNAVSKSNTYLAVNQGAFIGFAPVFREKSDGSQIFASGLFDTYLARLKDSFSILTRDGKSFSKLVYSKREVENIAQLFKSRERKNLCLVNADASELNFKNNAGKYSYVHLATHSFINEDQPALSGIAFYQPNASNAKEDGIFYSAEIYNLDLNADLVVLSSCESGLGKLIKGEGIMALTRGFLYSGARNIIITLWQVIDEYSSQVMIEFYKQMLAG